MALSVESVTPDIGCFFALYLMQFSTRIDMLGSHVLIAERWNVVLISDLSMTDAYFTLCLMQFSTLLISDILLYAYEVLLCF